MKTPRVSLPLVLLVSGIANAQVAPPPPAEVVSPTAAVRSAEELEQLLAPIALYPDALIAIILPASVASTDIVLAARHLRDNPNDRSQIEHRAWDESVKSLAYYPEVLTWMDENLPWTKQVGDAFIAQPADVMQAIQRLRARARAAGTLVDTPQQQIVAEPDVIRIVPAQPDIIYVPRYEPEIVFVREPVYYTRPLITFGVGVRAGSWLAYDCDWRRRTIWVGNRYRSWQGHDWRRPLVPITASYTHVSTGVRQWRPPARPTHHSHSYSARPSTHIIRPTRIEQPPVQRTWTATQSTVRREPTAPAHVTHPTPAHTASARTYSPRPATTRTAERNSPPQPQLYTTPTGRTVPVMDSPQAAPVAPSSSWNRGQRGTAGRIHSPAVPQPAQPVMGPQPGPGHASTASANAPRLTTRAPSADRSAPAASPSPSRAGDPPPPSAVRPGPSSPSRGDRFGRRNEDAQR